MDQLSYFRGPLSSKNALLLVIIALPLFSAQAQTGSTQEYRITVDTVARGWCTRGV